MVSFLKAGPDKVTEDRTFLSSNFAAIPHYVPDKEEFQKYRILNYKRQGGRGGRLSLHNHDKKTKIIYISGVYLIFGVAPHSPRLQGIF